MSPARNTARLAALCAASLAGAPSPTTAQAVLAITDVNVIPMNREVVLRNQTVLIEGDRIRAIGPGGEVTVPASARRIEGRGRFLMPGLSDMHVHPRSERDLDLLLANGVTFARIMAGRPSYLEWRDEIAAGNRVAPRLYVAGPIIESAPPPELASVIPTAGKILVETFEEGAAEVARQAEAGYDFIKVYNNLTRRAYEGVTAEARRRGLSVVGHVPFEVGLHGALDAGQTSIEHLRGYIWELVPADAPEGPGADLRSRILAWRYADPGLAASLASQTAAAGVWNCPTLSTRIYTLPRAEVDAVLSQPETAYMPPSVHASLVDRSRIGWLSNFSEEDFVLAKEGDRAQDALIRGLRDSGAGILAGTDIAPWGFSLHRELERLAEAGLSAFEVLETTTRNPAAFLDAEGDWGLVAVGARADLLLLDRNPLEDITATRSIEGVVFAGRWLPREELDALLEDR